MDWLRRHFAHVVLALIILVGAFLRFFQIDAKTVWLDEAFSIWIARHPLPDLWSWLIRIDQHPPLYYSLLHLWQIFFGDRQGPMRSLSALLSTATLPVFYLAGRRFFERPTALIATLILALSPLHLRYAQETRMYALLTLLVAIALYLLAEILLSHAQRSRKLWLALAATQAAIMLTHNTAAIFFPLALNLAVVGALLWKYWQGEVSSWPALNDPGFERRWIRGQLLAVILWLPWSLAFVIQSVGVDRRFWIPAPSVGAVWEVLHNFNVAFLPGEFPLFPLWDLLYWGLAVLGVVALRRTPARALFLLSLWLTPFVGELLVSLRRPIFYERTLLWTTLPYYLLIAVGIRRLGEVEQERWLWLRRPVQAAILAVLMVLSVMGAVRYYFFFEKEEWAKAAGYVAGSVQPGDLILFNASWVQIPFEYYFRDYQSSAALHGLPVDLFDRGELEPKMTEADVGALAALINGRRRVWLVYSHDWYTDPQKIIPRELSRLMRRTDQQDFRDLQIMRFEER
ncbi:MAG TPA: glycosyltransferase family 39 protein [Caldilineaceae bacterium]|nr:glycosyltransferase family 39 protein [Caldilineaceae bacterium]